jgi:transcriptional regulator with GAF, ATPase, and Fis domain
VEVQVEHTAEEVKGLRLCINDLVSVLALPAMWSGAEPARIVHNLIDALISMLQLDLVYVRLHDTVGDGPIEMFRVTEARELIPPPQVTWETLKHRLGDDPQKWPARIQNPIGNREISIILLPLGLRGEIGLVVAGTERADFPSQTEKLLLSVAVNQAAIGLQEARLLREQKRVARELDRRVKERTKELAAANVKLQRAFREIKTLKDQLQKENVALREEINFVSMFEDIVGSSEPLRKALHQLRKVAPSDSTVLILGETGTGKELIARAIHKQSRRSPRAFIGVNCAAIPQSLIASELFGHEKGAFTGATERRIGRFEAANGGTIFLDEVGDLPAEVQISLLRVLQEREVERVGSNKPIPVDVRVLAATHRDLEKLVSDGKFRQDLVYRLNVVPIEMPSLRERAADIPLLVEYFIARFEKRAGKKFKTIDKNSLKLLQEYEWPGNVRELQNVIERAVILSDSDTFAVDETWLRREESGLPQVTRPLNSALLQQERAIVEAALVASHGRVAGPAGAAVKLGIPTRTLDSKIKRLGIDKYRFKSDVA